MVIALTQHLEELQRDPIRLFVIAAPILGLVAVHRNIPDQFERISRYGFRFANWENEPFRLVSHLVVHGSNAHLAGNCASLGFGLLTFRAPRLIGQGRWIFAALLLFASAMSGLYATYLDNQNDTAAFAKSYGFGISFIEGLVSSVHSTVKRHLMSYCGASGGIAGLIGFNVVYQRQWGGLLFIVASALVDVFDASSTQYSAVSSEQVGHAAHAGGAAMGAAIALAFLMLEALEDQRTRVRYYRPTPPPPVAPAVRPGTTGDFPFSEAASSSAPLRQSGESPFPRS